MEALLVDEPADEQDQPLVRAPRSGRAGAAGRRRAAGRSGRSRSAIAVTFAAGIAEHVGDVAAHVVRAGDHAVGVAHHPPLDRVDVRLRVLVDPALVAAVLGRVDGHQPRHAGVAGELARRAGDQPVVRVDEVELELVDQLRAGRAHVLVHVVDPGDERVEVVLGEVRLAHAVDDHAVAVLLGREVPAAARQHVHLVALRDELLGQLAHVARQAALDDRRVLPGEDQDAHRARAYLAVRSSRATPCSPPALATGAAPPTSGRSPPASTSRHEPGGGSTVDSAAAHGRPPRRSRRRARTRTRPRPPPAARRRRRTPRAGGPQLERAHDQPQLARARPSAPRRARTSASAARRCSQSTGRRLSGSTSDERAAARRPGRCRGAPARSASAAAGRAPAGRRRARPRSANGSKSARNVAVLVQRRRRTPARAPPSSASGSIQLVVRLASRSAFSM